MKRSPRFRPVVERLESRELLAAPVWSGYGGNAQHTALSTVASQSLQTIRWSTPVDQNPQYSGTDLFIHYGSPSVTPANTVIVPIKTGATGGFEVEGFNGGTGSSLWTQTSDYIVPTSEWTPSFSGVLASNGRYYFPGAGGTVYYINNPDTPGASISGQVAFFGNTLYQQNAAAFNSNVQINTPLTADSSGNIYFGYIVLGPNPANLQSGIARIDASGNGTSVGAAAAAKDNSIASVQYNSGPALSLDQTSLYVAVNTGDGGRGYLLKLDSTNLTTQAEVTLFDPVSGDFSSLPDISTASPMVGPDGTVFFGVMGNPYNGSRGFMLHYSADLATTFTPGAFGWDDTASIVPSSMVPSYTGTSPFLIFTKYNNYVSAETGPSGGDGVNEVAVLDPYATQLDNRNDGNPNLLVMKEVMTIVGPTPDTQFRNEGFPNAVREWCINTAAVDPATDSILVNSEDGSLYRWNLGTGTFTETINLAPPTGEAYTPTIIGADGTVFAINNATLWAVGALPAFSVNSVSVTRATSGNVNAVFTVTLNNPDSLGATVAFSTADGTAKVNTDYTAVNGTLTFAPGTTTQTITVPILPDATFGPSLTFNVSLSSPSNAVIATLTGVGTIINGVPPPVLTATPASATANTNGTTTMTFNVTLSAASPLTTTVDFATADGTAVSGVNYTAQSGMLTFNPNVVSQSVTITVLAQSTFGPTRTFSLDLSSPVNASISAAQVQGTILNSVLPPALSIGNAAAQTGSTGLTPLIFTVSLSAPSQFETDVTYATADGSGHAGTDYVAQQGTLKFLAGVLTQTITANALPAADNGFLHTFTVNLSNAVNASIANAQGVGTIMTPPTISINNVTASGNSGGSTLYTFTVTLSGTTPQAVTAIFSTVDDSAVAGVDYTATHGQLIFTPGQLSQTITVTVGPVTPGEPSKDFFVELTGIQNALIGSNQGVGSIVNQTGALSVNDVTSTNLTNGALGFEFTISLAFPTPLPVTVVASTSDGSAVSPSDYTALPPTLVSFAPNQTSQQIIVLVNGSSLAQPTKTFFVNLSKPTNATLVKSQGTGTILSGVSAGVFSLDASSYSVAEGQGATVTINVLRTGGVAAGVSVNFATSDGANAIAGTDYVAASGTVTFAAGQTSQSIVIPILDNEQPSAAKQFGFTLSAPTSGATLGTPASAVISITNTSGTPNQRLVLQVYRDLLGRQADPGGLAFWTGALGNGMSPGQLALDIESSLEYRTRYVNGLYMTYLGRQADPSGLNADLQFLSRTPLIPGNGDPAEQLRLSILGSTEYFQTRGNGTAAGFLNAIYGDVLGRAVDPTGAQIFGNALGKGASTTQVAQAILSSPEAEQDFVQGAYMEFLRRSADPSGLNAFVSALAHGQSEFSIWAAILGSAEYFNLVQQQ